MSIKKSHSQVLSTSKMAVESKFPTLGAVVDVKLPTHVRFTCFFRNIRNAQKGAIVFEKQVNVYLNFSLTLLP